MRRPSKTSHQVQLFRNERLEKFTMISLGGFVAVWAICLPLIAWVGWGSASPMRAAMLGILGLFVWTLFEYALHRFVFHWKPGAALFDAFVFIMHGNHHDHPNDSLRNLMPPIASFPIAGTVWLACLGLAGAQGTWVFLGFMVGYVIYDVTHYACHQWPIRGRVAQLVKRHHMRHHHVADEGNYAITALFWDRMMGTTIRSVKPQTPAA